MIKIGLYGKNGHQIQTELAKRTDARLTAIAEMTRGDLPQGFPQTDSVREYVSLEDLLDDPEVELISLCSPRRADQARHAIQALEAGKHVLAEKPCALTEADLDAIIEAAKRTGRVFHEMAGTAFGQPYFAMHEIAQGGCLGEIVQIIAEKSYPYYDGRPQDESLDGGQILQNGVHALRFIEHVAGAKICGIHARETTLGNPVGGDGLVMAASIIAELSNGGIASIVCNYLNQPGTGVWGNESLRILGSKGFVESHAGGQRTRLVIGETDHGPLDAPPDAAPSWLGLVFENVKGSPMPLSLQQELSPTRWAIRAKAIADQA